MRRVMRRPGFTLIEFLVCVSILAVVLTLGVAAWQTVTDPYRIGARVRIGVNGKAGTIVGYEFGGFEVNYADDRGDVRTARVLRSQVKILEAR